MDFNQIDQRLSRIEDKLDKHLNLTSANQADISWIKGYVKLSITALISLTAGLLKLVFKQ